MKDNFTLLDYKIEGESTIYLVVRQKRTQKIFIKSILGKILELDIMESDSIKNIKDKIFEIEKIPPENQILMLCAKKLEDNSTISDYEIQEGSTLILIYKNRADSNEQLNKKIELLEKELKEEKNKNKILEEKTMSLEKELNEKINLINELRNNNVLKNISEKNIVQKEELYNIILEKEKEIKNLKLTLSRYPFELKEGEKLMNVNFITIDSKIQNYSLICKNTDIFNAIEKRLYEDYKDYYNSENYFTVNGNRINKYKNLDENNIRNNDVIVLNIFDIE